MDAVSNSTVSAASDAAAGTVQGAAAISMLKKSNDMQVAAAIQLIQALPKPAVMPTGSVGTTVDTFV